MPERRLGGSLATGLVAVVAGFWCVRFAIPDEALLRGTSDLRNYFYPLYELFYGRLAHGQLMLWNADHIGGYPQLATLQGGYFYPPHLLYVLLPTHIALAISHVAHLIWIALTTALLMRTIGVGGVAACVGALIFTLRGSVQWWLQWPAMLEAAAWLPLGCIAVIRLAREATLANASWLGLATAMCLLAGHTQVAGYLLWVWVTLFAVAFALQEPRNWQAPALFAGALAIGALASGIQTLPTFELTLSGTRNIAGIPASQVLAMRGGGFRSFADLVFASQFSLGVVALVLIPAALFHPRCRAVALWALFLGGIALLIASISSEGGVDWYRSIPAIGWFRSPSRILFLVGFCASVVAAIGVDSLTGGEGLCGRAASITTLVASAALAFACGWQGHFAIAAVALGVGLAAAAGSVSPRLASIACAGIAVLTCVDAGLANSISGRLPYRAIDAAEYRSNAALNSHLASQLGPLRALSLPLPRSRDLKLAGAYGVRRLDDFEPLNLRRQSEYFTYLQMGRSRDPGARRFFSGDVIPERPLRRRVLVREMHEMASRRRLLDVAGASLFVTPAGIDPLQQAAAETFVRAAGLGERTSFAGNSIARNPHVVERAFVTYRTLPAPEVDRLLSAIADPAFDPLAASFVEGDFALPDGNPERGSTATIQIDESEVVEIEATLIADGLVVLADAYYRGWRATVDGQPAPIFATNHLFRGVPVPAGTHRIRFEYRPASVRAGGAASLVGWALLGIAFHRSRAGRS
jgi:hypothetical protein